MKGMSASHRPLVLLWLPTDWSFRRLIGIAQSGYEQDKARGWMRSCPNLDLDFPALVSSPIRLGCTTSTTNTTTSVKQHW